MCFIAGLVDLLDRLVQIAAQRDSLLGNAGFGQQLQRGFRPKHQIGFFNQAAAPAR